MTISSSLSCRTSSARRKWIRPICVRSTPARDNPLTCGIPAPALRLRPLLPQPGPPRWIGLPWVRFRHGSAVEAAPAMLAQLRADMASSGGPQSTAQSAATAPNPASQAASQVVAPTPAPQPALPPATAASPPGAAVPAPVAAPPATSPAATAPTAPPASRCRFCAQCALRSAGLRRNLPGSRRFERRN